MSACPSCGHENQEAAKFCSECATPLEAGGATPREERKIVTVLFADLVGFTAQAERLDPEDVRALLAPYHARLRTELERFGGTVEKFIGDAVMALFGAPVAHEDDPERAVRAALAIRDWVLEDDELQLRIAVNTGEALVALGAQPSAGEGMASGDVVNVAARLQAAAPVNGILVGEATYRATRDVIDYQAADAVEAKGKAQPIPVWQAVAPRSALGVDVVQAGRTPLIGRGQELTLLLDTAERVRTAREPQIITLVGVPGIGKSRLTFELFNALTQDDGVLWRQGRCLPYGEGVAFWAIGEIVKSHAEIFESDPAPRAEQKLRRAVSAAVSDEQEADRMIRAFRPLVGLTSETTFSREGQTEAFAAWRRFFEALAEQHPLVLVLEDLHWGDDQLLDFVDELVDWAADVPLLVLCTARPELLERRPDWGGGKLNATTLSLRPLSHDDTARVLAANLERPMLEAAMQAALLERAGGNPLYAEQYARMLAERSAASELPVPETVQAIVASRLDGLAVEDKELLHDAAVHGKVFWAGAVAAMTGGSVREIERRLHALERKEFVRRERRSAVANETQYVFRHMLVRDVAYGQIPRRLRAEKHRLAAEWIASLGAHREDHVELLADHYECALEFARASGGDEAALVEPARVAFRSAGERADKLGAWAASARFFRNALDVWPAADVERPRLLLQLAEGLAAVEEGGDEEATEARDEFLARGDLEYAARAEVILADIAFNRGQGQKTRAHTARAVELTHGLPASETKVMVLVSASWRDYLGGKAKRALAEVEEARAIAEEIGARPQLLVMALQLMGGLRIELGDHGGVDDVERALALAGEIHSPEVVPVALNLGVMLFELGQMERANELIAEARAESSRLGHLPSLHWADTLRMRQRYWSGDWDAALRLANEALKTEGDHARFFRQRTVRSQIYLARGRIGEAVADAGDAVVVGRSVGDSQALHSALAVSARANLAAGARGPAIEAFDEVLERIAAEGSQQLSAYLPDLVVTAVDLDRAEALRRAITNLGKELPWIDAGVAFLDGEYLTAAAHYSEIGTGPDAAYANLRAARFLLDARRREEAEQALGEALAFFRSVGATRYVTEGEALLAVSA